MFADFDAKFNQNDPVTSASAANPSQRAGYGACAASNVAATSTTAPASTTAPV
jgi:hypothetical protein